MPSVLSSPLCLHRLEGEVGQEWSARTTILSAPMAKLLLQSTLHRHLAAAIRRAVRALRIHETVPGDAGRCSTLPDGDPQQITVVEKEKQLGECQLPIPQRDGDREELEAKSAVEDENEVEVEAEAEDDAGVMVLLT